MLHITKLANSTIYYTATENTTIDTDYFLFIFEHRATLEKIILLLSKDNASTDRFDVTTIEADNHEFDNATEGLWKYTIRQKPAINPDMTETGLIVETGYMMLHPSAEFEPTIYEEQLNTFTIYNGE